MNRFMKNIGNILVVLALIFLVQGCGKTNAEPVNKLNIDTNSSYAYTPISSNDYKGMKCVEVVDMFYNAGFESVSISVLERSATDSRYKDGDIYSVKVGNMVNFEQNDAFDPYAKVEITYIALVDTYGVNEYEQILSSTTEVEVSDYLKEESLDNNVVETNNVSAEVTIPVNSSEPEKKDVEVNNVSESPLPEDNIKQSKENEKQDNSSNSMEPVNNTDSIIDTLEVHFIDVGQGDCTLIKCGTHAMLIDAGPDSKGTAIQLYLTKQNITSLDYVLLTHFDEDHAGGADVILTKFDCNNVILPSYVQDNKSYRDVMDTMTYRNYSSTAARVGDKYSIGGATFEILSVGNNGDSNNNQSICLRVDYGNDSFLFTGDADGSVESRLINSGMNIDVDVFQVGHHGSKDSNSVEFINKVRPTYAVISCGANNSYGHPTAETLNGLRSNSVEVFRTDEQGSIIASTKGTGITWSTMPSTSWKAGETNSNISVSENSPTSVSDNASVDNISSTVDNNQSEASNINASDANYIGNKNNNKLHKATCSYLPDEKNRAYFVSKEDAIAEGYDDPCKRCNP